jgi:hypothetical protein
VTRATIATLGAFIGGALVVVAILRANAARVIPSEPVAGEDQAQSLPDPPSSAAHQTPSAVASAVKVADGGTDAFDPTALDDTSLMARLRAVQDSDPALAYDLAKEGLRRFPGSADSPERAALAVKALSRQGKRSEARGEAEVMVNQYPNSPWAREVEIHTGAHPHRNQTSP